MDSYADFRSTPANGAAGRLAGRGAVFALHILLHHPEILASQVDDCEPWLRMLGKQVVWPQQISHALHLALTANTDEEAPAVTNQGGAAANIGALLKSRQQWSTYEDTISRLYAKSPKLIVGALEDNLARLKPKTALKAPGNRNIPLLVKLLDLEPVESRLLDFVETRGHEQFRRFLRTVSGFAPAEAYGLVAAAIDAPTAAVKKALRANATLRAYGLVTLDSTPNDLEDFLRLDNVGQTFLVEEFTTPEDMLRAVLQPAPAAGLAAHDYPHMEREFAWLVTYLKNVANGRKQGANVLLYGAPGTGKSEFARLLAEHAGLAAFDVRSADSDGDPVAGKNRLNCFAVAQRFLSERERSLVIFDEIEDVFPDLGPSFSSLFGRGRSSSRSDQPKAWLNQQLEHSPVPAIWITNSIDAIDDAFLRRFSFHIEFRTPPKAVRERVIRRCLESAVVSDSLVTALATDESLSPAQVNQASRFALLCNTNSGEIDESVFLQAIKASQTAMGRSFSINSQLVSASPCNFAYLNLDSDLPLEKIEQALRRNAAATLCFHGVPGSGKTSLARHLADAIGRPLAIKRASDLLGKYVGEAEKNIARMFHEASQEGAVLLLDEADSFLRSRQQAQRSWEVTQVNELLQQMEAFNGIFICTTNLMNDVDEAAMRRFTFKLRFDALTPQQVEALFAEIVFGSPTAPLTPPLRQALQKLTAATPGDFATVQRQERLLGERYTAENFLQCLERECAVKKGAKTTSIGFLS
ncbi:MAG: Proteasomal ATPase [Candidatus Accumulibacter appositus]|uniref:Proteasomal ATPase n=1 Tax=Candidatus Accumulibacter appositus TaxID=1454003 RepID=A0A011PXP6_9PROT|nr:ATP-binding protein [Accumulibacter sp.]EXI81782.1 MAG: Proteasomal ATPase [Candidatus Accumulibacter appositus]HRF04157.1 ATP-binding protein [Accumulibacter sp.]